jgi:hypothetical protein
MTTRKRFKRLVRARAAKTGESYVTALRHFRDTSPPEDPMSHKEDIPTYTEVPLKCSFCGKSQTMVKKVIAGPGVYICDECVVLCVEIIAPSPEERAGLLDRARTPSADSDDEPDTLSPGLEREIRRIVGDALTRTQAAATDPPDRDRPGRLSRRLRPGWWGPGPGRTCSKPEVGANRRRLGAVVLTARGPWARCPPSGPPSRHPPPGPDPS